MIWEEINTFFIDLATDSSVTINDPFLIIAAVTLICNQTFVTSAFTCIIKTKIVANYNVVFLG